MIGQKISHYKIIDTLGEGGLGAVYSAEDSKHGRMVALRVLPPGLNVSASDKRCFADEAKIIEGLAHPNVGGVYGLEDG